VIQGNRVTVAPQPPTATLMLTPRIVAFGVLLLDGATQGNDYRVGQRLFLLDA
jgi:hypothetical protein